MGRIVEKFAVLSALIGALTLSAVAVSTAAGGTDVVWRTVAVPWASYGAGTAAAGDSIRWQHITDENDSTRTAFVSTADWAWDAALGGASQGVVGIAYLTLGCITNNLSVTNDSLYIAIEKRAPNGKTAYNTTITAAIGTVLTLQGAGSANGAVFRGQLQTDLDALELVNLIYPGDEFRLVLKGDVAATSPAMGKCSLWLTYPARRASQ